MSWLDGKTLLLTGAGGGIGRATCRAFARQGATVVGLDLDDAWVATVRSELGEAGRLVHATVADATQTKDVAGGVEQCIDLTGRLDMAVAAAGIQVVGSVEDTSEESWDRVLDINLTATWLLCKHTIPALRASGGGTILCLGSTAGLHPRPNLAAYCVSKAGVSMLARVLGREVAGEGIRVVAVCPTGVDTPLLHGMIDGLNERAGAQSPAAGLLAGKPVQRWLSPDEVADGLVWLTSPAAAAVTGSSVPLDFGSV
jgi:NAD(P)-dependent dehydrogenase (short-subunit alcohol dehydrogenase family)